ncbi:MAG: AI-2E family transporter [Anaerolineae bacterium]|nr:AI-2E family transporter [Anaerolineae bacterium]
MTPIQGFFFVLFTIGSIALLIFTAPVWEALLVAAILAYLLNPLVARLVARWHGRRGLATALVYVFIVFIILSLASAVGALIWGQAPGWAQELQTALHELGLWMRRPFIILGFTIQPEMLVSYLQRTGSNALTALPVGSGWLGSVGDNLLWSLVVLVGLFYLLRDGPKIPPRLIDNLPPAYQEDGRFLLAQLDTIWRVALRVQLIIFAIIAILFVISTILILWLFRLGWLPLSPIGLIVLIILVYAGIQQIDNLWLRPQYMGHALKLHPGVVMVALISALALTGILGAIVVVPVLASLKVLAQYAYDKWQSEPPPPDAADDSLA